MGEGYRIVLTADRTLMSEYGGGIFFGFSACVPKGLIPDRFYFSLFCPPVEVNDDGTAKYAPCGTRKVEAALLDYGFRREDVAVAHPEHLDKVVGPNTRAIGITENDPLGIGPATFTFTQLFGGEAHMAVKFRELLNHPAIRAYGPKIIVGGAGAWQLEDEEARNGLGIDCVVIGEGEKVVGPIFERAVSGQALPGVVYGSVVPEGEIPTIVGPTISGLIEIARGCGRGCGFCATTLQRYRCLPLGHILKEVKVNLKAGRQPLLHAEDVLRYKARGLVINEEAVVNLFKTVRNHPGVDSVGISHFALSSVLAGPDVVEEISNILCLGEGPPWLSGQTGIETGSPRLIREHMAGKCKPFEPEDWPEVVVRSFEVLARNNWVPCATLIMGLPGETEKDIELTLELLSELRSFKSLVVPLFLVPLGGLKGKVKPFSIEKITPRHSELFLKCWEHNVGWASTLAEEYFHTCIKSTAVRYGLKLVLSYSIRQTRKLIRTCRKDYDYDLAAMIRDAKSGKIKCKPLSSLR
ncbi:TPA: B12-binding domain-containing radical SAM protein [Candidatus Bathyarchaeota archaeon]|nr:B12-binding domain-containing radical SAM protein [Candidatus Bathyarchaeota archaeon]